MVQKLNEWQKSYLPEAITHAVRIKVGQACRMFGIKIVAARKGG